LPRFERLVALNFEVEAGKAKTDKLRRPVLFGEMGHEDLAYEVDAFHAEDGIALEVRRGGERAEMPSTAT
jgi:hypothetical protein